MHFCPDEIMALAAMLPFVGAGLAWCRSKLRGL